MATDYDAPRNRPEDEASDEGIESLRAQNGARRSDTLVLDDEANLNEDLELPGADLSAEELIVRVLPKQSDEFTCTRCFLVTHTSQRARTGPDVCRDCA
jgi:hypothetical protein